MTTNEKVFVYDQEVVKILLGSTAEQSSVQKVTYIDLLESSIKLKDERNAQLQLDNQKLREALEVCKYDCHTGEVIGIAKEALGETK
jgi:hypothetical protein